MRQPRSSQEGSILGIGYKLSPQEISSSIGAVNKVYGVYMSACMKDENFLRKAGFSCTGRESQRWGVWGVSFPLPMNSGENARRNLESILSELKLRWADWKSRFKPEP